MTQSVRQDEHVLMSEVQLLNVTVADRSVHVTRSVRQDEHVLMSDSRLLNVTVADKCPCDIVSPSG